MAKLGESVKEIEDGGFKRALGAVEVGIDDFPAQELLQTFYQVQVGRIGRQKGLYQAFAVQPRA